MKSSYAVLTGAPCSGKSTMIAELSRHGFITVDEKATEVINDGISPMSDPHRFRTTVLSRQMEAEQDRATCPSSNLVFLDRGSLDGIAYCKVCNDRVPDPFHWTELTDRYGVVLLLDPLPFWEDDGVRYEDASFASQITPALANVYESAGLPVHRIPVLPKAERMQYVFNVLTHQGVMEAGQHVAA